MHFWNVFDTDGGGVSDGDEILPSITLIPASEEELTLQIIGTHLL